MKKHISVLTNNTSDPWVAELSQTLSALAVVRCLSEPSLVSDEVLEQSLLIVIDAGAVKSPHAAVAGLRSRRPDARVIVMTASPTWQRARSAFEAGALDYLSKSLRGADLVKTVKELLKRPLRPRSLE
jgi:DNA-binding NarL/FixJ family response regulator